MNSWIVLRLTSGLGYEEVLVQDCAGSGAKISVRTVALADPDACPAFAVKISKGGIGNS